MPIQDLVFTANAWLSGLLTCEVLPTLTYLEITWWKEPLGSAIFLVIGIKYILVSWDRVPWQRIVIISAPLFVIAVLFFVDWLVGKHNRAEHVEG